MRLSRQIIHRFLLIQPEVRVYKYSFRCIPSRNRIVSAKVDRAGTTTRVAVAGATGYTGQELLRILSRHPSVLLTAAMSSGTTSRKLPALARLWNGEITPLSSETLREADVVFLALPDAAAAGLGPDLIDAGVRVIDLSGAFRLRDASERARWYPETHRIPDGLVYGLTELERTALAARVLSPTRVAIRLRLFWLWRRS